MKKGILFQILSLLLISLNASSQSFLNLDFEYGVYKSQPRKWAIEGEGEMYGARLDSTTAKSGVKSLFVTLKKAEVYTFLSIPARFVAGKNMRIEGYIKFKNADSLTTMLAFRNPNGGRPKVSPPIKGNNNEWTAISYEAAFPGNFSSDRLLVALIGMGTGDYWLDKVSIKINGRDFGNGTPDFREPTGKEIIALNSSAIPVNPFSTDADNKDLIPLNKVIGNAVIVGLGENSHGSSSVYKMKLRLLKYLVKEKGFSIFALEAPTVEADRVNDYLLYDKGTLNDVIKNLVYPSWQTQEMLDILQWIKWYNQTAKQKVEFRGFDMQDGRPALDVIERFARVNDTALFARITELKNWYDEAAGGKQQWSRVYQDAEAIAQAMKTKDTSAYTGITVQELSGIKHYMNVFVQSLSFHYKSEETKSRDEYMAQNIDWLIKTNSGRKIIVSADNTHVTKASGKMGSFLKALYNEKYIVFGFTYGSVFIQHTVRRDITRYILRMWALMNIYSQKANSKILFSI